MFLSLNCPIVSGRLRRPRAHRERASRRREDLDRQPSTLAANDDVVVSGAQVSLWQMPTVSGRPREGIDMPSTSLLTTMNIPLGAGFYAHAFGSPRFVAGSIEPVRFTIFDVRRQGTQ